jgi:sulfatase maturation enzyme AslB (radical SAM superfamily)
MRLRAFERLIKGAVGRAEVQVNSWLGREFIPRDSSLFHIETSSACNLNCRFCAYAKKSSARTTMSNDCFSRVLREALDLGYNRFELTPCTGDVFMDRRTFDKLAILEADPRVVSYMFFTNFTIPPVTVVERLLALRKLSRFTVSVYGHDEASFVAVSRGTPLLYRRLIRNLEALLRAADRWPFEVEIAMRTSEAEHRNQGHQLVALLDRFRRAGADVRSSHGSYNNWGGLVSKEDVAGLDMQIGTTEHVFKRGACVKLFDSVQVMADGSVNACACRDANATLRIGHVDDAPLAEVLRSDNPAYRALIDEQQQGVFRPVCRHCDFYKSIYHQRSHARRDGMATQTLQEFLQRSGEPATPPRPFPVPVVAGDR